MLGRGWSPELGLERALLRSRSQRPSAGQGCGLLAGPGCGAGAAAAALFRARVAASQRLPALFKQPPPPAATPHGLTALLRGAVQ